MSRYFVRPEKQKGVWSVQVVDRNGHRTRNSVPSFCKCKAHAMEEAKKMAIKLNMPIYIES